MPVGWTFLAEVAGLGALVPPEDASAATGPPASSAEQAKRTSEARDVLEVERIYLSYAYGVS